MTSIFLLAAVGMTPVTVLLVVSPLLRRQFKAQRRAGEIRVELQTLDAANAAGAMSPAQYAAARHVLGEALLDDVAIEPKRSAPILYSAIAAALLMPLAAFGIYRLRDTPPTLQAHMSTTRTAAPLADHGSDIQASISKLAAKLREQPDDAEGWALLGRTYKATEHYPEARDAFQHAVAAAPGDAGFEREYAAAETPDNASAADDSSGGITVKVSLDPKLNAKVSPSDTLFVFAKAAQGPAMPLAIARLTVAQLPASVTLSDSMAMMPSLTLSKFPQIVLGARISKSGNAVPQKGDYQTVSSSLANSSSEPFRLTIDQVVE